MKHFFTKITVKRVEQVAQKYCAVSILRDLQGQTGQTQSNLIWLWSWSCFEPEVELDTFPEFPSDSYDIIKMWKNPQINI